MSYQQIDDDATDGSNREKSQAEPCCNDAKRERHGKIPHRNGNAVTQAVDDMLSIACHISKTRAKIQKKNKTKVYSRAI